MIIDKSFWYNEEISLKIEDVFHYDIKRCIPSIFRFLDMTDNIISDKQESLIMVGYAFKNNKLLYNYIHKIIKDSMNKFIDSHMIEECNIINILKDGLLISKKVREIKYDYPFIPTLRDKYKLYLSYGTERKKYMLCDYDRYDLKGFSDKYPQGLFRYFNKLIMKYFDINDSRKKNILLQDFQYDFKEGNLQNDFVVEDFKIADSKESSLFYTDEGQITLHEGSLDMIDTSIIDYEFYYEFYLRPFITSLVF